MPECCKYIKNFSTNLTFKIQTFSDPSILYKKGENPMENNKSIWSITKYLLMFCGFKFENHIKE